MRIQSAILALIVACASSAFAASESTPEGSRSTRDDRGSYGKPASRMERASSRIAKGDYVSAIDTLERHLKKQPEDADAWNLLGYANRKLERYEVAEEAYGRALRIAPDHKGALEYRGELYLETARPDEARAALRRLESLCPSGCEELALMREAFSREGVSPEAAPAE